MSQTAEMLYIHKLIAKIQKGRRIGTVLKGYLHIILALYFHELIALDEGLLMKVVGIALIVYHTNLALVFRHEHVNIAVHRVTVVPAADYLAYTLGLASHVMKFRKIIEVMQSVYT